MPVKIEFSTEIDTVALNEAFQDVCRKFPTLRNIIEIDEDGNPKVQPWAKRAAKHHHFNGHAEQIDYSFSLSEDLPIRAFLEQTTNGGTLTVVFNHVALDGWSLQTVISAFGEFYRQHRAGEALEVSPSHTPAAVRRLADGDTDWWKAYLSGAPQELALPLDRPRTQQRSDEAGELSYALSDDHSAKFNRICQKHGVTPFVVAQGILAATLYKVGAGTDVLFGTVNAGREHPDSQSYVGYLANTIPVRLELERQPHLF